MQNIMLKASINKIFHFKKSHLQMSLHAITISVFDKV